MILFNKAKNIVEREFKKLKFKTEKVDLLDSLERIIAEDVYADMDQPLFTNSAMDGYAIKYADGISKWKIIGEICAGGYKEFHLNPDEAVLIMTGSKIPEGANTVIPIENVVIKNKYVKLKINKSLKIGMNVRLRREDIKKGNLLIKENTVLRSNNITIAASSGKKSLKVYKKLNIGVMATGNELVDINIKPENDKIRASNLYSLMSAITEINMTPVSFGIVKDNKEEFKKRANFALNSSIDILLTTGGVSAGKYDLLKNIFKELNVIIKFSQVNIKPGKPIVFGIYKKNGKRVLVFGLPGNPVSCYVNFILFVRNVIINELTLNKNFISTAVLNETLTKKDNKRHFLRGIIHNNNGTNFVSQTGSQSSANIKGLNSANCLIVFNDELKKIRKGNKAECIMM